MVSLSKTCTKVSKLWKITPTFIWSVKFPCIFSQAIKIKFREYLFLQMESFWKFWEYLFLWIESFEGQENFDLINFSPKEKRQLNKGTFGWYFCQDQQKCRSRCYIFLYSDLIPTRKTFVFGHFSRSVRPWDKDQNRVCLLTKHSYSH